MEPEIASRPTNTRPGSPERIAVYRRRAGRGVAVFHPGDAPIVDGPGVVAWFEPNYALGSAHKPIDEKSPQASERVSDARGPAARPDSVSGAADELVVYRVSCYPEQYSQG